MPVERRGWVIAVEIGSTGNGRNPIFNGRREPSCGGTSRMTRECQVRFCERLGGHSPGLLAKTSGNQCALHQVCFTPESSGNSDETALTLRADLLTLRADFV